MWSSMGAASYSKRRCHICAAKMYQFKNKLRLLSSSDEIAEFFAADLPDRSCRKSVRSPHFLLSEVRAIKKTKPPSPST